jgi:hypothetical protein
VASLIVRFIRSTWTVGPRVVGFGQAMLDPVHFADHVEADWPRVDCVPFPGLPCELNAIVGQNGVDLVRHCLQQVLQELPSGLSVACCDGLRYGGL